MLFLWILLMCKLPRITHKLDILRALLRLCVICRSLHINKIYKNKIHSYNVTQYKPRHVISNNVAFLISVDWDEPVQSLLSLEIPNDIQSVA